MSDINSKVKAYLLTKQAGQLGDMVRGAVSPTWQAKHIAKEHGKEGPKGIGKAIKTDLKGHARAIGSSVVHSLGGAVAGAGVGAGIAALANRKRMVPGRVGVLAATAGAVGQQLGASYGSMNSYDNQGKEQHKKYSQEKKAALDLLIEGGMDFNSAVAALETE